MALFTPTKIVRDRRGRILSQVGSSLVTNIGQPAGSLAEARDSQALLDREINGSLVYALAKTYRWQEQLESGEYTSLEELAAANGIDRTYVGRFLRLTSLAPEIVERILDGDEQEGKSLAKLRNDLPVLSAEQTWG